MRVDVAQEQWPMVRRIDKDWRPSYDPDAAPAPILTVDFHWSGYLLDGQAYHPARRSAPAIYLARAWQLATLWVREDYDEQWTDVAQVDRTLTDRVEQLLRTHYPAAIELDRVIVTFLPEPWDRPLNPGDSSRMLWLQAAVPLR